MVQKISTWLVMMEESLAIERPSNCESTSNSMQGSCVTVEPFSLLVVHFHSTQIVCSIENDMNFVN